MKLVAVFLLLLLLLLSPQVVSAHTLGQPPFFKVQHSYSGLYPVPSTSLSDFNLPQDLAPHPYHVNEPILFEIDTNQLPVPLPIIQKSKFYWDFGDGTKGEGLQNTHTYTKPGSYLQTINVDDGTTSEPQLLQSTLLHIVPEASYQLPKSIEYVNGGTAKDPLVDIVTLTFGETLTFDGSRSKAPSSKITSYFWDFGDGTTSTEKIAKHTYNTKLQHVFPMLRVTDKNGFLSDSFIQIDNELFFPKKEGAQTKTTTTSPKQQPQTQFLWIGILIFILGGGILLFFAKRKN